MPTDPNAPARGDRFPDGDPGGHRQRPIDDIRDDDELETQADEDDLDEDDDDEDGELDEDDDDLEE
jgi:hypothetical protein